MIPCSRIRLVAAGALFCAALAQSASVVEPARAPLRFRHPLQDKNFYVATLMEETPGTMRNDAALSQLAERKRAALSSADPIDGLKFSEAEIAEASEALERLYAADGVIRRLADGPMLTSGAFIRDQSLTGVARLTSAWKDAAHGMNNIIDVYALGHAPRYPAIDSAFYDIKAASYGRLIHTLASLIAEDSDHLQLFFQPTMRFALGLLDANHRDEAARFEPMETGENSAAVRRAATVDWKRFTYSAIVVPGSGNESESVALSAWGKLRLTLAVRRFRQGKAPFLLVSGGYVHPKQTAHCEAMEMKRSLMADFGVPEDAILVDPHARHTTTNLRNAVRELYRYGLPFGKPALITTDADQSTYIEGATFADRCRQELGYEPALKLHRLSQFDLEFSANIQSLQLDARDPLDP